MMLSLNPAETSPEAEVSNGSSDDEVSPKCVCCGAPAKALFDGVKLWAVSLLDGLSKPTVKSIGTSNPPVEPPKQKARPLMISDLMKLGFSRNQNVKVKLQGMLERNVVRLVEDTKEAACYIKKIEVVIGNFAKGKLRSPSYMPV